MAALTNAISCLYPAAEGDPAYNAECPIMPNGEIELPSESDKNHPSIFPIRHYIQAQKVSIYTKLIYFD
jgi:hypothetical protein